MGEELKSTVWAGEFRNTSGDYKDLQPFSLGLNNDGTFIWNDFKNAGLQGRWIIKENKIRLEFPNGAVHTANVSKDEWSNFTKTGVSQFEIGNVSRSVNAVNISLDNTVWKGKVTNTNPGSKPTDMTIRFFPAYQVQFLFGVQTNAPLRIYTNIGAGIRDNFYGGCFIFLNNATVMKGYSNNSLWYVEKQ